MRINENLIIKNINTFTNGYGITSNTGNLIAAISGKPVDRVGLLLRDVRTKTEIMSIHFPVDRDITDQMLWVPIERPVESLPIVKPREGTRSWFQKRCRGFSDHIGSDYRAFGTDDFRVRVHKSLYTSGVVEKLLPKYGFIRRTRGGIFFLKEWCDLSDISVGQEIKFIPIVSRKGLQARAIESPDS